MTFFFVCCKTSCIYRKISRQLLDGIELEILVSVLAIAASVEEERDRAVAAGALHEINYFFGWVISVVLYSVAPVCYALQTRIAKI